MVGGTGRRAAFVAKAFTPHPEFCGGPNSSIDSVGTSVQLPRRRGDSAHRHQGARRVQRGSRGHIHGHGLVSPGHAVEIRLLEKYSSRVGENEIATIWLHFEIGIQKHFAGFPPTALLESMV